MQNFTDEALLQIIAAGKSDRVAFKAALAGNAPEKIREAICAFANDLPCHDKPGFVFVGVGNDKTLLGLQVTDRLLQQLADMKTDGNILPPPSLTVEKRVLKGKEFAVVKVEPSNSPPVRYKGAIHIRTGTRRDIATVQDEHILNEKRRYSDHPFDLYPIPEADMSTFNLVSFNYEYLPKAFSSELLEANARSLKEQLAATKMITSADQPTPTVFGMLTIGKNPQDFLYGAYVQFLRIDGDELTAPILDSEDIRGAIPDQIRRLDDKLISHNRVSVDLVSDTVEHHTEIYPLEALQQITRNAVMHRTYQGTNAPVRVTWFNDRVEVLNPGGVYGSITAENFGQPGCTDYRNPNLAEAMKTLGYVQKFGVGIQIAKTLLKEAGHPEPEFKIFNNHVLTTIKVAQKPEIT